MLYIIGEIFTGIFSLFKRNNKIAGIIGLSILAFLMGSANSMTTTDYPTYEYYYNYGGATGNFYFEKGYSLISLLFYKCGFDYPSFRLVISFVGFFILFIGLRRFTNNIAFFSFAYGVTLFFNDATQVRNFLMISIVIFALSFLLKGKSKKNYFICVLLICLSGEIHSLGYLFILIPLFNLIDMNILKENFYPLIFILCFILLLFAILRRQVTVLIIRIGSYITTRQGLSYRMMTKYSDGQLGSRNILIILGIIFLSVVILCLTFYLLSNCNDSLLQEKNNIIFWSLLLSLITTPLLTVAIDYSRISRNLFLLFIILISIFLEKESSYEVNRGFVLSTFVMSASLMAYLNTIIWGPLYVESIPYLMKVLH